MIPTYKNCLPCPFCAGEIITELEHDYERDKFYSRDCTRCGASSNWYTKRTMAVNSWNNRKGGTAKTWLSQIQLRNAIVDQYKIENEKLKNVIKIQEVALRKIANNKSNGQEYSDFEGNSISGYELNGMDCAEIAKEALNNA